MYLGSEVYYSSTVPEQLAAGGGHTLNGSHYVLLEFGGGCSRSQMLNGISACIYSGVTPVIAHVEHYDVFYIDASLIEEVRNMGALIQVNTQVLNQRASVATLKGCIRSWWRAYRIGYASLWDFLYYVAGQLLVFICPGKIQN